MVNIAAHVDIAYADARLIAAAPDLLQVCKEYVQACEDAYLDPQRALASARDAIAKATGQ